MSVLNFANLKSVQNSNLDTKSLHVTHNLNVYIETLIPIPLASCQIYAWAVSAHPMPVATSTEMDTDQSAVRAWQGSDLTAHWSLSISMLVWLCFFIEPDLFKNNILFDNTTSI